MTQRDMTGTKSATQTEIETQTRRAEQGPITPLEEQVVRMRHGLRAPATLALQTKGQGNPELEAQLLAMEERALAAVGARSNPQKRKIVAALRRK